MRLKRTTGGWDAELARMDRMHRVVRAAEVERVCRKEFPRGNPARQRRGPLEMLAEWGHLSLRLAGFVLAAVFLLVSIAGVLLWPRNLAGFFNAQKYYWRELFEWVRREPRQ